MLCYLTTTTLITNLSLNTESNFFRCSSYYVRRTRAGYSAGLNPVSNFRVCAGILELPISPIHFRTNIVEKWVFYIVHFFDRNIWKSIFLPFKKSFLVTSLEPMPLPVKPKQKWVAWPLDRPHLSILISSE